ncbi:SagB-type dehydrogenase domain-containing protein [Actinokineospora alba]|uniref:SagB-type dehydrogenase domain-containing protein n=1 Tax=Actinokineospora alba TaxID=504798 RepID=A0A1H0II95_9PSEU|nr:nitroreductase family protein [Actinokineospora alba]TDP70931.1 SagB-type dehydrogenase family enzyme [Actinokineospora alba]SDI89747.1 SagB-type dehydrogenase domain-containing protein [Actinokineospora alba]SDO31132.1 SagB-type dehydrogenase domain-containing protein [Actinokineospora alba]
MSFDEFWTESGLSTLTQRAFAERLGEYRDAPSPLDPFVLPSPPIALHRPKNALTKLFAKRRSERGFGTGPLRARDLGAVLAALAETAPGRRSYPSAGGLTAVRAYPILLDADHALSGRITRYDPRTHALQDIAPCPEWTGLAALVGAAPDSPAPQLVVVLVLADIELFAKYGPRAGRFGLVEAGAAAQSLALAVADRGLGGYLLGGAADRELLAALGLAPEQARLAVTFACGRTSPDVGVR